MAVSCIARYLCELSLFLTWCRCAFCHWPYHVYCHTRYTSACVICELKNYLLIYILKIVILLAWVRPVIEALTWVFRGTVYMCRISYQSVHVRANGAWQLDSNNVMHATAVLAYSSLAICIQSFCETIMSKEIDPLRKQPSCIHFAS